MPTLTGRTMTQAIEAGASLIDVARKLYAERGTALSTREIARAMGSSHEWVRQFVAGNIPNPGVLTLEKFIAVIEEKTNV